MYMYTFCKCVFITSCSIESFWFEKENRVIISNGGEEETLSLWGTTRDNNLKRERERERGKWERRRKERRKRKRSSKCVTLAKERVRPVKIPRQPQHNETPSHGIISAALWQKQTSTRHHQDNKTRGRTKEEKRERERDKKIKRRIEKESEIIIYIHTHIPSGLVHEHRKTPHSVSDSVHHDPQLRTVHAQLIVHNHSYHRNGIWTLPLRSPPDRKRDECNRQTVSRRVP